MKRCLNFAAALMVSVAAMADNGVSVSEPISVFPTGTVSYATEVKPASDGSVWAVIYHPDTSGADSEEDIDNVVYEYRLQLFGPDGVPRFPAEGLLVSNYDNLSYTVVNTYLLVDKEDNAIVIVADNRNSSAKARSYTAYKYSPSGESLWSDDGVPLSDALHPVAFAAHLTATELDDGSFVFAWMESAGGSDACIRLQRLSADGRPLWDKEKMSMTQELTSYPYLVNSGDNTCILVYAATASSILCARKIDFEGESVWGQDTEIYSGGFGTVPLQMLLEVRPAGDGGVLVSWTDDRNGTNIETPYLSFVTSDGRLAFSDISEAGDVKLTAEGLRCFNLCAVPAADGSAIYTVWRATDDDQKYQGIKMQKVSLSGELLWGDNGIDIYPMSVTSLGYVSLQQAGSDGACAFFEKYNSYFDQQGFATRIGSEGEFVWNDRIIPITFPNSKSTGLSTQPYLPGYWLYTWEDGGTDANNGDATYYMNMLSEDGLIGVPAGVEGLKDADASMLTYAGGTLYGPSGSVVKVFDATGTQAGEFILVDGQASVSLAAGFYVARAGSVSLKFMVK